MDKLSILLVDNPYSNITKIDSALSEAGLDHTLYFAESGRNGLYRLMGNDSYHELSDPYSDLYTEPTALNTDKIKPGIVILSKELMDISALEFLSIVRKYYSLRNIRFFLLSNSLTDTERFLYEELGVSGYLQRPLDKEQIAKEIQPHLNGGRTHFALLPITLIKPIKIRPGVFIKSKIAGMGIGAKVAAVMASALMISGVARYNAVKPVNEPLTADVVKTEHILTESPLPTPSDEPTPISEPTPQKQQAVPQQRIVVAISPDSSHADSTKVTLQKNESPVLPDKPHDLRIRVVEEPDSISH